MRVTNGLIAAITRFDEREVYNEMQLGNLPTCLACGSELFTNANAPTPLCNTCAHEFVDHAAQLLSEIKERLER